MKENSFIKRHNGVDNIDVELMLKSIGVSSLDELIDSTVPKDIRLAEPLAIPNGIDEYTYLKEIGELAKKNKVYRSYIGMGYFNTITPSVILRNIFENPGWYTAYTPYQAEISQGRLEALLNFQTMVTDLTGMNIANASLLDESTAAAEAMIMLYNVRSKTSIAKKCNNFFIADHVLPQTIAVVRARAEHLNINIIVDSIESLEKQTNIFGALVSYTDKTGCIHNLKPIIDSVHSNDAHIAVTVDLLSLTLLTPPGELGADIVLGNSQRLGVPVGFGGPHAAFFATREEFKRSMPGRIIGKTIDSRGMEALRMALQTREQHIKREKATSNICTAQALLAIMAGCYAVYHGPEGLKKIAKKINCKAGRLADALTQLGIKQLNQNYFDTLFIDLNGKTTSDAIAKAAVLKEINFNIISASQLSISIDETVSMDDLNDIIAVFAGVLKATAVKLEPVCPKINIPESLQRSSTFLTHSVFNSYHNETQMMRYLKKLENKDLALNRTMIPLGSCTMKLNAATEMMPLSWPAFANLHPFAPLDQSQGYQELIAELGKYLCIATGFDAISFQPNSGAAGEYTGLLVMKAYHLDHNNANRNMILIPSSAHGTNPASAAMAGIDITVVKCDVHGHIDIIDLQAKATQFKDSLFGIMLTYPSTHGVYEDEVRDVIKIIHDNGGLVYMDGANMNAQVGLTSPGFIGADVCHLNLHKTFAIPHGGGGPGMGPICVNSKLAPYLPSHPLVKTGGSKPIQTISASPYGSALVLLISYGYIKMAGGDGLTAATKTAILNANYLKSKLAEHFPILYTGTNGHVAHEMILDCNGLSKLADITVTDIAKRLMDYGFHAPTVAFPVHGTLMVEPTESEPVAELDRFVDAMVSIRKEIQLIIDGKVDAKNNVLKNAPHTCEVVCDDNWNRPYTRMAAAFAVESLKETKYWPPVGRVDDAYGDRNLVCTCSATLGA